MKKTALRQQLSKLKDFNNPKASLEQYSTPPELAADMVHSAFMKGDLGEGSKVVDPGTGTGILAIGAALTGSTVVAVEKDPEALETARENAKDAGVWKRIDFREMDVSGLKESFDTCVMNPPFSVHSEEGEKFFSKAFDISDAVYSIVYEGRTSEVDRILKNSEHRLEESQKYTVSLPPTQVFHTEEGHDTELRLILTRKAD